MLFQEDKMKSKYKTLLYACYSANISMSVVGNISPLLFLTFRSLYGISYSLLGLLVLINFATQLTVDLIFSFFSHKFNIQKVVKFTPVLTFAGLLIYAIWPLISPKTAYVGIVIGTLIFASSGGLVEVLISPVVAAIPSDDPDREMSKLHSVYAWGVVPVIVITTLFLLIFGGQSWQWLIFFYMLVPLTSAILFAISEIPPMKTPEKVSGAINFLKNPSLWLCVILIFLGGAAECTMAQWASSYLEAALGIPKILGDVFGVALFALMLGIGRSLYAKRGKNIYRVLLLGSIGAAMCYLLAAIIPVPAVALIACALTGLCVSMLWPGCLIVGADRFPESGIFIYAMMASGGDLGASVGPQLVGIITDIAIASPIFASLSSSFGIAPEQLGMKLGMLIGMLFPLAAVPLFARIYKQKKTKSSN